MGEHAGQASAADPRDREWGNAGGMRTDRSGQPVDLSEPIPRLPGFFHVLAVKVPGSDKNLIDRGGEEHIPF